MPGRTVTALESRYGARGGDVLDLLRRAAAEEGIGPDQVRRIAERTGIPAAHVRGAASFYSDLGFAPAPAHSVRVCTGTACFAAGGGERARGELDRIDRGPGAGGRATAVTEVRCLGCCYGGPAALDGEEICAGPDLADQLAGTASRHDPPIPCRSAAPETVVLAGLTGDVEDPWEIAQRAIGRGPAAREWVGEEVFESGLRGRGGAGFPAALKWRAAAAAPPPHYVICNGDEGDPGSYVDRLLMERDPHRVLAGLSLAGFAAGAERGFVYVRSEYPAARDRLREAVVEARGHGHLGEAAHGQGCDFDVEVFEGAGSYVAGEETSLIHSIEGLRGDVLPRPPFPSETGLLARPTVVNNVETLCAVPWIVDRGGASYARLGQGAETGTKVVCLNERFRNPGAYEVELGVPVRWICETLGGGLRDGLAPGPIQVGGPLGGFLHPDQLDVPLSFEALREIGADLGHGSLIAFDDSVAPADILRHIWRFAAEESCGACVPCRLGTRRGLQAARADPEGGARAWEGLESLSATMAEGSMCAFGRSVPSVIASLIAATEPRGDPA